MLIKPSLFSNLILDPFDSLRSLRVCAPAFGGGLTFENDCDTIKYSMDQPVSTPLSGANSENSAKHVFMVYLSLGVMAFIIAIGGYFLGLQQSVGKKGAETTKASLTQLKQPANGFQKAQNAIQNSKGLITQTKITQTYSGALKSMVENQSWTLEKNGKTVTLRNDGGKKVYYFIRLDEPNAKLNPTTVDNIKIGNNVLVVVSFSASGGAKTDVERVILILPAASNAATAPPASNAASPSAQ